MTQTPLLATCKKRLPFPAGIAAASSASYLTSYTGARFMKPDGITHLQRQHTGVNTLYVKDEVHNNIKLVVSGLMAEHL